MMRSPSSKELKTLEEYKSLAVQNRKLLLQPKNGSVQPNAAAVEETASVHS
jgi:hypothetical protein